MNKLFKKRFLKVTSIIVLLSFINEIAFPTLALALTNGNTQPEVWDYQPVEATDNISLLTGGFNYTLPVTSIPEYPMAIGYRSGLSPDQEAGMFGLGFHGFSGAIGRNLFGIPDDINGADKIYRYLNQKRWSFSLGASVGLSVMPGGGPVGLSASVNVNIGYDNYTGVYGSVGFGLGVGISKGLGNSLKIGAGVGIGLVSDSRSQKASWGWGVGISAGISRELSNGKVWDPVSVDIIGYSGGGLVGDSEKEFDGGYLISTPGITNFSMTSATSVRSLAPLANVVAWSRGVGLSLTFPIPVTPPLSLSVTIGYNSSNIVEPTITKKSFGYNYLSSCDRRNNDHISDMTIEGENSFPELESGKPDPRSNPSYLQRDYLVANAMGISGNMQFNQLEYGVVSRNYSRFQYRDIGLIQIKTSRQQVYPWAGINESEFNNSIDLLKILKSDDPEDRDFDRVFFKEKEVSSLTSEEYSFGEAQLRMRGDMAGEFNMASINNSDPDPNMFSLVKVAGGGRTSGFMRTSLNIPLYKPEFTGSSNVLKETNKVLKYGTVINYKTVGEILSKNNSILDIFRFKRPFDQEIYNSKQSYFNHNNYEKSGQKSDNVILNDHLTSFSIIKHLADLNEDEYFSSLIGSVEVKNAGGIKYIFGLPAFAKETETLQLSGKGINPPVKNGNDDYCSFSQNNGKNIERSKVNIKDDYIYPYAWLLTAIVGDDYIDFDEIPGPSDGDIGFWVKFKYTKIADNYRWRVPFTGLEHIPGAIHTIDDDAYSLATGQKEIYVLSEIESAGYISKYNYQKRYDGLDAKNKYNGKAINILTSSPLNINDLDVGMDPTGDNFQFAVTSIDLFKKHFSGNNSQTRLSGDPYGKKIKSTFFEYDYSLCPNVPNNLTNYPGFDVANKNVGYIYNRDSHPDQNIGTGKLTLRKIQHVAYDENGGMVYLPSYTFSYWPDVNSEFNPPYNDKQVDRWGNYSVNSKVQGEINTQMNFYHNYCEYDKEIADKNSKVYHLNKISLPSGGILEVEFEAQDYGYVEDKKPYVMRKVKPNYIQKVQNGESKNTEVYIDVTDICREELSHGTSESQLIGLNWKNTDNNIDKVLSPHDTIFGQIAFYQQNSASNPASDDQLFIAATRSIVVAIKDIIKENNKYYQKLELKGFNDINENDKQYNPPYIYEGRFYSLNESLQMRAIKEKLSSSCNNVDEIIEGYENLEKDDPLTAARKVVANLKNIFVGNETFETNFTRCFGAPASRYFAGLSFMRTPIFKGKYTGSRVKNIAYSDEFHYATLPDGSVDANSVVGENKYESRYYFDNNENGTGRSSMVATIEPGGGDAAVINVLELVGAGYAPSPAIISSKTILETSYADKDKSDNIISRNKGKTIYEFYTPKDDGLQFSRFFKEQNYKGAPISPKGYMRLFGIITYLVIKFRLFGKTIQIKIPIPLPVTVNWNREDNYRLKSYSFTDYSDIFGKPKSVRQINAGGQEDGSQQFNYFGKDEKIPVYDKSFDKKIESRPGKVDQAWSEGYYTKEDDITLIPAVLFFNAKTSRNFNYNTMKYVYVPPVLSSVTTIADGIKSETINTGFDYYTGTPVEVRSNDSYYNVKIKRIVPAYWEYPEMGPIYENKLYTNNLTSTTGSYLYLNSPDTNHLLGASVTRWSKDDWNIIPDLIPVRNYVNKNEFNYKYTFVEGEKIKAAYNQKENSKDKYIKRNVYVYRPYETYTYETELNKDGTFNSFSPFNYQSDFQLNGWKRINTNVYYNANGVLVQSRDILDKYSSQHLGYNNSNAISIVANAGYFNTAYEGAENIYSDKSGNILLEADKVKLGDAGTVESRCESSLKSELISLNDFMIPTVAGQLKLLKIIKPAFPFHDKPFARMNITFNNGLQRTLFIFLNYDGSYRAVSNAGEEYEGFLILPDPDGSGADMLLFDYLKMSNIQLDTDFESGGYLVSYNTYDLTGRINCEGLTEKQYFIPDGDCGMEVHTGNRAFKLDPGKEGTIFTLSSSRISRGELLRKYKALVWVHKLSPPQTELVMKVTGANGIVREEKCSMDAPYASAGNWRLMRLDFDLSGINYNTNPELSDKVDIFIRNGSTDGISVYDDFRVLPYHAEMSNYVYDPAFNRVISTLDADNFASFTKYDTRGRVIESAVEIEGQGKNVIKKMRYNDQKKD